MAVVEGEMNSREWSPDVTSSGLGPRMSSPLSGKPYEPANLTEKVTVQRVDFLSWPVFEVTPHSGGAAGHVLYLHGGGYASGIGAVHWNFVSRLAEQTDRVFTVPILPLTPRHTHADVFPTLGRLYASLAKTHTDNLAVMGDSSGGGMALALIQSLPDETPRPKDLVLLWPWLDATVSHPDSVAIEPSDPFLRIRELRVFARMYAGTKDPSVPEVSPINGPMRALGRVTVFVGTNDLLNPDAHRLALRAGEEGADVTVHEYPKMIHGWMLRPLPESHHALNKLAALLTAG